MDRAQFSIALPDNPDLLGRLTTALAVQSDPPIAMARTGEAVLAFECATGELMLRSRVIQALEVAAGPTGKNSRDRCRARRKPSHAVRLSGESDIGRLLGPGETSSSYGLGPPAPVRTERQSRGTPAWAREIVLKGRSPANGPKVCLVSPVRSRDLKPRRRTDGETTQAKFGSKAA